MEVVTMRKEGISDVEVKVMPQEIIHKVEGKTRKELEKVTVEVNLPYGL
jgi:predicted membrane GTPase involved in stress response